MNNLVPESIRLNIPFIILLALAAVAFLLAWWLYRQQLRKLSFPVGHILLFIRMIVYFLVLVLFLTPVLNLSFRSPTIERVAIFIDNSGSVSNNDMDSSRWELVLQSVEKIKQFETANSKIDWFSFNAQVEQLTPDTIQQTNAATNFTAVFSLLEQGSYDQAVLISDGNQTDNLIMTEDNLNINTQIHTIGIGQTVSSSDVFISTINANPIAYDQQEEKVEVQIGSNDIEDQTQVVVRLFAGNSLIGQEKVELGSEQALRSVYFKYTPDKVGLSRLKVVIDPIKDELNTVNNQSMFVQDVLKSKLKITLFAGSLSYDSKFINHVLTQLDAFDVDFFVQKKDGTFFNGRGDLNLSMSDNVIFCGFPTSATRKANFKSIAGSIKKTNPGLIVFYQDNMNQTLLSDLTDRLPFNVFPKRIADREIQTNIKNLTLLNPILNIYDSQNRNEMFWTSLPPISGAFTDGTLKNSAEVILYGQIRGKGVPLIWSQEQRQSRSVVLNGTGYWRWHFLMQNQRTLDQGYKLFINQMIRWTTAKSRTKPVMLLTEQNTFRLGEVVQLKGKIYDASFKPVISGVMQTVVENEGNSFSVEMISDSSGIYQGEFVPAVPGRFKIRTEGFRDNILLGEDEIEIEIIPFNKEYFRTNKNEELLQKIAKYNNGLYLQPQEIDSLKQSLNPESEFSIEKEEIELWYTAYILIFLIILITTEWIIRKKVGLA